MSAHPPPPPVDPSTLDGGINAYKGDSVIACSVVFIILCTIFLVLRFVAHRISRSKISWEDWIMIPAWVLMMGLCANVIFSVKLGDVGRHQLYVLKHEPKAMKAWAQALFVTEFLYGLLIPLVKSSILLLYLRLFSIHHWFRYTTYGLLAYIWLWGISETLVSVFQCKPVAYQWNKELHGKCIDQLSYYRWVSVPNVIHDVVMLVIPAPVVWKLKIDIRQKLALSAVFFIGSIGCIASFIRMANFFQLNALSDNTWASIQLMSWTLAEPGVILICACAPALWPLIRRAGGMSATKNQSKYGKSGASGTNGSNSRAQAAVWNNRSVTPTSGSDDGIPLKDVQESSDNFQEYRSAFRQSSIYGGVQVTKAYTVTHHSWSPQQK